MSESGCGAWLGVRAEIPPREQYDNSSTAGGNVGSNPYNRGGRGPLKPEPKPVESKPRKPMDLKKLQEWMEIRKRVEQNKREEGEDD